MKRAIYIGVALSITVTVLAMRRCEAEPPVVAEQTSPPVEPRSPAPAPTEAPRRERVEVVPDDTERKTFVAVVRDLADGAHVAGAEFRLPVNGDVHTLVSDGSGQLVVELDAHQVPPDPFGELRSEPPYRLAGRTNDTNVSEPPEFWVYREIELRGRLTRSTGIAADSGARVRTFVREGGPGVFPHFAQEPWSPTWLKSAGLRGSSRAVDVPVDSSTFTLQVPRIRGLIVVVAGASESVLPSVQRVTLDASMEVVDVEATLTLAPVLSGRISTSDGRPLGRNLRPVLYVTRRVEWAELDSALLPLFGQGLTGGAPPRSGESTTEITQVAAASRVEDGAFEIRIPCSGRGLLVVSDAGYSPVRIELGQLHGTRSGVDVVLRQTGGAERVTLTRGDLGSLQHFYVTVVDVSSDVGQPGLGPVQLDAEGTVPASMFVRGHDHYVFVGPGPDIESVLYKGFVTWTGQSEIDVATDLREAR